MKKRIFFILLLPLISYASPHEIKSDEMFTAIVKMINIAIYIMFPICIFLIAKQKRKMSSFLVAAFFPHMISAFISSLYILLVFSLTAIKIAVFFNVILAATLTFLFLIKVRFINIPNLLNKLKKS